MCVAQVVTFDDYGVSGHANHRDAHRGVLAWAAAQRVPPLVLTLSSRPFLLKYSAFLDMAVIGSARFLQRALAASLPSAALSHGTCPAPALVLPALRYQDLWLPWRCLQLYASQSVFYRQLFVLLSSYTYVNVLEAYSSNTQQCNIISA